MYLGDIAVGNRLMNHAAIAGLEHWLSRQIIGQADLVRKLLIAVLAGTPFKQDLRLAT